MDTRKLTNRPETSGNAASDAELTRCQQALCHLFVAFVVAVGLLLLERVLGGGWRSLWSFGSTVLLIWAGLLPVVFIESGESWTKEKILGVGAGYGIAVGLAYGVATRSPLPGVFFGMCIGHFVGLLLHLRGFQSDSFRSKKALWVGGAVAGAIVACHLVGVMKPTRLIRVNSMAAETTIVDKRDEPPKPAVERNTDTEKSKKEVVVSGMDLVDMNPIAVSKLPSRFVVTGRVVEMENSKNLWGTMQVTIKISGDADGFHKNARGYVDEWVECEFSNNAGLEKVQKGQFVYIEGQYENNAIGSVVHLTKCRLSPEHHVVQ